jgi:hypothetical protein
VATRDNGGVQRCQQHVSRLPGAGAAQADGPCIASLTVVIDECQRNSLT